MEDIVYYNELNDIYGELLTEKQRKYFEDYYFNNLSFSEMAQDYDISINAAFKQIHIVIDKLLEYERVLNLHKKRLKIRELIKDFPDDIKKVIDDLI